MNHFSFIEIPTTDLKRAQRFYGAIFGWTFRPLPGTEGKLALDTGGSLNGFLIRVPRMRRSAGILLFVEVPDIDSVLKKVRRARGTIVEPKREVPDRGWTAVIASFDGCALGLWQPYWFQAA